MDGRGQPLVRDIAVEYGPQASGSEGDDQHAPTCKLLCLLLGIGRFENQDVGGGGEGEDHASVFQCMPKGLSPPVVIS